MRPNGSPDQAVDVPFTGGMGEGVAPFVLNVPFVELAEDCVITKEGAYRRFPGGSSPAMLTGFPGGSRGLSVFDSALVQHTVAGPQQYNETANAWRASNPRGFVPTQARSNALLTQPFSSAYNVASAVSSGGFTAIVWDEQSPDTEQNFGRSWTTKRMAVRDPSGGWTISPQDITGSDSSGHQVIAVGGLFFVAYSNSVGFQVFKLPEAATSLAARVNIVVNATGSSIVSGTRLVGSVHDSVISTSNLNAYFVVCPFGSTTYYIYTVGSSGLVGSASTGTGDGSACYSIAVSNSKVYVGFTPTSGGVTIHKVTEGLVTTGVTTTAIGNFALASNNRGFRLRVHGYNNTGIFVAVEGPIVSVTTDMPAYDGGSPTYPSYRQLPLFTYTEIGFLPDNDLIANYTNVLDRAYAHNYSLGSAFYYEPDRGIQIGLVWNDFRYTATTNALVKETIISNSVGSWLGSPQTANYGGLWLEVITQSTPSEQGAVSPKLRLRSLARYAWDSAVSAMKLTATAAGGVQSSDYTHMNFVMNSFSRVDNHTFTLPFLADTDSSALSVAGIRSCVVDTSPKPPLSVVCDDTLYFDGSCQDFWDGIHSYENTPHFPPAVAWVPKISPGVDPVFSYTETFGALGAVSGNPGEFYPPAAVTPFFPTEGFTDTYSFYWEFTDSTNTLHRSAVTTLEITQVSSAANPPFYTVDAPGYFLVLPPVSSNGAKFGDLRLCVAFQDGRQLYSPKVISKYLPNWEFYYGQGVPCTANASFRVSCGPVRTVYSVGLTTSIRYEPSQIPLYTDGGILQAEAPPSPVSITSTRDRLWAISADNRRVLYYTKPIEAKISPEFNAALALTLPADAGEGVVVLTVDDKPVVLCERGLYAIIGDGPNALGLQGDFVPQVVQSDTGCVDKNSTAKCDYGAFFQGERGIYLLDRGLNVSLISQGVQNRAQADISKAVAVPREQQIRFGLTNSGILVYHYALKAWTYLNKTAYDAVVWDNFYTRVFDAALFDIATTDESSPADSESTNTMRIKTSWIKADKMQGFARFKRILLLHGQQGVIPTAYGPITVKVYFNYEEDPEGGSYFETSTIASANRKPADVRSQVDVRIGRQKVESIKLDITSPNYFQQGDFTEFYDPISLEGICLVVGTITNTQFRHLRKQTKS